MALDQWSVSRSPRPSAMLVIIGTLGLSLSYLCALYVSGIPIVQDGPSQAILSVADSLWRQGSLSPEYFRDMFAEVSAASRQSGGDMWQDIFSLGVDGALLPKHSVFSALVVAPFYGTLGLAGVLFVQEIAFLATVYSIYALSLTFRGVPHPMWFLIGCFFCTPLIFSLYGLHYDLHGTALILGGFVLARRRPGIGAAVMTLSIFVRPSFALLAVPLSFLWRFEAPTASQIARTVIGVGAVLALFASYNWVLFGAPYLTSYHRIPVVRGDELVVLSHPLGFDWGVLFSRWGGKIFGASGVLPWNIAVVAAPWVAASWKNSRAWSVERRVLIIAFLFCLYIFSYPMWDISGLGNRFLLPAVCLYLPSFIGWGSALRIISRSHIGS